MKVVREGEIKEWEVKCPKCKSLLRYGHEDIRTNFFQLMFTQPCFIRNARKELAFNVAALGYVTMYMVFRNNIEGNHLVLEGDTWHFTDSDNHPHCIDCGTNEDLFLAIASLRDDTDKGICYR